MSSDRKEPPSGRRDDLASPTGNGGGGRDAASALRDLRHRVSGSMQLVLSLLRLRMMRATEPAVAEALADAVSQLEAVMLVQRQLDGLGRHATADAARALEELCRSLAAGCEGTVVVETRCASLPLTAARLEPLLLLASEAIVNALRHAFPTGRSGRILVTLRRSGADELELTIEDDGIGLPPGGLDGSGVGGMLMQGVARQLGGRLEIESGPGTRLRLLAPLSSGSPSPAP
jgi:two-component sensor histidine kinase